MSRSPLLILLLSAAVPAAAQVQSRPAPKLTGDQQSALRQDGFDPAYLSPAAVQNAGGPAAFAQQHQELYRQFAAWRQDPAAMLEAERKKPGTAEAALNRMSAFVAPEQIGYLRARLKLAPHDIKGDVPAMKAAKPPSEPVSNPPGTSGGDNLNYCPVPQSGLHTSAVPDPQLLPAPPSNDAPLTPKEQWVKKWCAYFGC
ncbi:MAG: hypothetical protein KGL53_15730 [Elusimicrobia bacterium]|nr:hypothetical protein [Elusimicrobiota bacterium]